MGAIVFALVVIGFVCCAWLICGPALERRFDE